MAHDLTMCRCLTPSHEDPRCPYSGLPDDEATDPTDDPDMADLLDKLADADDELRRLRSGERQWRRAWKWEQRVRLAYERRLIALGVNRALLRSDQHDAHTNDRKEPHAKR